MSTLTIRLPDEKHNRLKLLAKKRKTSINKLFEEVSTRLITEFDVATRFQARASKGSAKEGLKLLKKLDDHFSK